MRRLSPAFVRLTFTGADLGELADNGLDQRCRLVLPLDGRGFADLPTGAGWRAEWRRLPESRRNPIRTFTVRAVRPLVGEVDVDVVLHGDSGPASRFASRAVVGDRAVLVGPNARFKGAHGGLEFRPPAGGTTPLLLAADETAVPAVGSILAGLRTGARGRVLLEVASAADRLDLSAPPGVEVTWLVRRGASHGTLLVPEARRLGVEKGCYAWLAAESRVVRAVRRLLVRELGVDRRSVTFMAYWWRGRPGG